MGRGAEGRGGVGEGGGGVEGGGEYHSTSLSVRAYIVLYYLLNRLAHSAGPVRKSFGEGYKII